jgi:hypothetical protein
MNNAHTRPRAALRANLPLQTLILGGAVALVLACWPRPAPAQQADAADTGPLPRTYNSASSARPKPRFGAAASAAASSAAASAAAASTPTLVFRPQRLIVGTVQTWTDVPGLSQRATAATGLRVRDVALMGPKQVAFTLVCADALACDEAITKLKSATDFATDVQVDSRRNTPHRPTPDKAR